MKTRAAFIRQAPGEFEVGEVELGEPRQNELLIKMVAAGLCHSDDHIATGDIPVGTYPMIGGHEGAGTIEAIGPNTFGYTVGEKIVFSFLPSCGHCRWCASGMQNLCDLGAGLLSGGRPDDPTSFRNTMDGKPVGQMCGLGTFADYTIVSVDNAVKVDDDVPLDKAVLTGCGVGTGWGSAVNSAQVYPGDTVIVMGIGGIGINAVQGAAHAGAANIIAVDPVAFKREKAQELGATHTAESIEEGAEIARSLTNGQGADSAIVTVGVTKGEHIAGAFSAIRKAGTCVVTGLGDITEVGIPISPGELTLFQKRLQGAMFGASNPKTDILLMLALYKAGKLKLDELITNTYRLEDIAQGYKDMHDGKNIRGVILFD